MPHYADGTEVKVGDVCLGPLGGPGFDPPAPGYVLVVTPGAETCNMEVLALRTNPSSTFDPVLYLEDYGFKVAVKREYRTCNQYQLVYRKPEPTEDS